MANACIRFIDSYRFLSTSLDSIVRTLVDNSHKTLKDFEEEIVDNDEKLNFVNEIKLLIEEDNYNTISIKYLKNHYPDEIEKLEEALLYYMGEKGLKILKTRFPDKWKYLPKHLAYPYEYFNSIDDYQKPVDNSQEEYFFSKLKNKCTDNEETDRPNKRSY